MKSKTYLFNLFQTLKLLISCLELCHDIEVLCAVLNTLCVLIESKEPYLENHIDDLLPRFLNLTTFEESMVILNVILT